MPKEVTNEFMRALREAEETRDPAPLVRLYADDATSENLALPPMQGRDGAREFWEKYLNFFQDVRSEFTAQTDDEHTGVMEWVTRGHLNDGRPIEYRGVSVIDVENGAVKRFRTYYDSAAFVQGTVK